MFIFFHNSFMDRFSAKLSENSAREFSFFPTEGNLEREGVVFTVLFKPITYGKIFKAKIIIQVIIIKIITQVNINEIIIQLKIDKFIIQV